MEWLIWYGLKIGFSYEETMTMPLSSLLEYIAIEQFKNEGLELVEQTDFDELLEFK